MAAEDDLPDYRRVAAQIQIDGATMTGLVTGQPIARSSLPDFVQEHVREEVELRDGVGAIEALAKHAEEDGGKAKLSLPMGGDIARVMNADLSGQRILSIYWAVSPVAIRGVLDQIRTSLTILVAELRATMPGRCRNALGASGRQRGLADRVRKATHDHREHRAGDRQGGLSDRNGSTTSGRAWFLDAVSSHWRVRGRRRHDHRRGRGGDRDPALRRTSRSSRASRGRG